MTVEVAFYGSLTRHGGMQGVLGIAESLELIEECEIPGKLYDLGSYPGLVAGEGLVTAELYRLSDPAVLDLLDEFEGYDPRRPERSLYVRRRVQVPASGRECWVYFYNRPVDDDDLIASGSWREHFSRRHATRRRSQLLRLRGC